MIKARKVSPLYTGTMSPRCYGPHKGLDMLKGFYPVLYVGRGEGAYARRAVDGAAMRHGGPSDGLPFPSLSAGGIFCLGLSRRMDPPALARLAAELDRALVPGGRICIKERLAPGVAPPVTVIDIFQGAAGDGVARYRVLSVRWDTERAAGDGFFLPRRTYYTVVLEKV